MRRFPRSRAVRLLVALGGIFLSSILSRAQVSVRTVKVLGGSDTVEIEVEASDRIVPQAQVLTGPDRLVVDFPNAIPGSQVRSQSIDRGEVKNVRVGLFQSRPPVTRVVVDLKSARSYQIFPSGRSVMIKVFGSSTAAEVTAAAYQPATRPGLVPASYSARRDPVQVENPAHPPLEVTYRNGLLSIVATRATLSEVLYAVQQRTGADISIPAGTEQERVAAEIGPAPAPEVLARLLNGSNFNFLIVSAPDNPRHVDRVILSPRDGGLMPLPPMQQEVAQAPPDDGDPNAVPPQPSSDAAPARVQGAMVLDPEAPPDGPTDK
ncbi:MAG TPA: AMIN domain-containing protein [Candidatus Sulfotelmatobacter sp.]|nr:AMIN domain-containing protein [Candidatus Sulfotelmatobacter sp.]